MDGRARRRNRPSPNVGRLLLPLALTRPDRDDAARAFAATELRWNRRAARVDFDRADVRDLDHRVDRLAIELVAGPVDEVPHRAVGRRAETGRDDRRCSALTE